MPLEKKQGKKIILYMHAGSGNHGCEAIVNSLTHMLKEKPIVLTNNKVEDETYSLGEICTLWQERSFAKHQIMHLLFYVYRKITKDSTSFIRYRYEGVFGKEKFPLAISIGGDNYCYDNMLNDLRLSNTAFKEKETATILLGCSIEPKLLEQKEIVEDLRQYRMIIARESITFEALEKVFKQETKQTPKLCLIPDPAFTLGEKESKQCCGLSMENTIGINVSPMIQGSESVPGITMGNYEALIAHILATTDMQVALVPHVVWERNDDREPLKQLYSKFKESGRVVMIADGSCEELKWIIGRCRMFIGARTHATIAAYSSMVPTLVVGYSVKAKGIAIDLFGTSENYVIPVQSLKKADDLIHAYEWLKAKEKNMREKLLEVMPAYCEAAFAAGKEVEKIWEELNRQQKI